MHDLHLRLVDLNLLVALDALLGERNVTRAAARIGITQSAIATPSRASATLTGDELLVRGPSGMTPDGSG